MIARMRAKKKKQARNLVIGKRMINSNLYTTVDSLSFIHSIKQTRVRHRQELAKKESEKVNKKEKERRKRKRTKQIRKNERKFSTDKE